MIRNTKQKYCEKFLPAYNLLMEKFEEYKNIEILTTEQNQELFNHWQCTFNTAMELLKEYMSFVGLYPADDLAEIRSAYYNEILKNGQDWINLYYYLSVEYVQDAKLLNKKHLNLFEQFKTYIESEIEVYNG